MTKPYVNMEAALLLLAEHGPMESKEIGEELRIARTNAAKLMTRLHRHWGLVYVADWRRDAVFGPVACFAFGPGDDAPKPRPLTNREARVNAKKKRLKKVASIFELGARLPKRYHPQSLSLGAWNDLD